MRTTTIDVVDKESYKCYDGLPESNENKFLIDVKELECPVALPTVIISTLFLLQAEISFFKKHFTETRQRRRDFPQFPSPSRPSNSKNALRDDSAL